MKRINKKQGGFTLVELIIVVSIFFVLIMWALPRGAETKDSARVTGEVGSWVAIFDKTKNRFQNAQDTSAATTALLRDYVFPANWVAGTTVRTGLGGTVTVAPADLSGTKDGIAFTATGAYSKKICDQVLIGLDTNIYTAQVNGTTVKSANVPIDRTALSGACADSNTIVMNIIK